MKKRKNGYLIIGNKSLPEDLYHFMRRYAFERKLTANKVVILALELLRKTNGEL